MISKTAQARTISFNSWLRAAEGGDLKTLFYGLAQGLAVNRVDDLGQNALMKAAYAGRDAAVELLLDEGAAIDAVDANGNTTLMRAAIQGRAKTVGILVKRGADVNKVTIYGEAKSALVFAINAQVGDGLATMQTLLDAGANPNIRTKNGMTPLMMMFANSTINPMMAKSLCEHGADPSAFQRSRGSALIMAVNAGELEMVKILLNAGASQEPVAVYKNYNPALHDEMGVEIGPVKWISAKLAAKQAHHENSQDIIAVLNAFEQVKTLDQQVPGSCEKAMPPRVRL